MDHDPRPSQSHTSPADKQAKRLKRAAKDRERKREARGGFKNPVRAYRDWLAKLPDDRRIFAQIFFEYRHWSEGTSPKRLSFSPSAKRQRIIELQLHHARLILQQFEGVPEADLQNRVSERWPNEDHAAILANVYSHLDSAKTLLGEHTFQNRKKQAQYRKKNLQKVRHSDLERMKAKRSREKVARQNAPFVAIDAEGYNVGIPFEINRNVEGIDLGLPEQAAPGSPLIAQDHRTFLWGAAADGVQPQWLVGTDSLQLGGQAICEWLVSLPALFPHAIFVMFAANYDWTQIIRDMPYQTAWELWNGVQWSETSKSNAASSNRRRVVLWGQFGLRLYPGKYIEIGKFRDHDAIKDADKKFDFVAKIRIYDTFGFFQTSFIKAANGFGGGFLTVDERDVIEDGKARRSDFSKTAIADVKRYTTAELHVLSRMMSKMREGLREYALELRDWHGAGCIAQAMMTKDHIDEFYYRHEQDDPAMDSLTCARHAYFGGRVELMKQGVHSKKFYSYDISSAYPHVLRRLPNMRNGTWKFHTAVDLHSHQADDLMADHDQMLASLDTRTLLPMSQFARSRSDLDIMIKLLSGFSLVSMVRVRFMFPICHRASWSAAGRVLLKKEIPWFPLPVRAEDGAIYFPSQGDGIYMVEEVRAMLRWVASVYADARESDRPMIALLGALQFLPKNDARPLKDRIERGFADRARILEEITDAKQRWEVGGSNGPEPYNVEEKVLKLGLNSIYGKTAQSKGARVIKQDDGELKTLPPKFSNMYYAAAATAGTRAMLLDAASSDIDGIISFATDAVYALRELADLDVPQQKTLGTWDASPCQSGVFVKAGIYSHEPFSPVSTSDLSDGRPKRMSKMRGIRPANLPPGMTAEQWLISAVPDAWANDIPVLDFPYRAYKTLGAAIVSKNTWRLAGHWIEGQRVADIQNISLKRDSAGVARSERTGGTTVPGERRRSRAVFDTAPAKNPLGWQLSRPYTPDWIDERQSLVVRAEEERKTMERRNGFGFDVD